jgi:exodeoxyribonuclease V gamma subunit
VALQVRFVSSVNDVVEPVVEYLTVNDSSLDLFEPQYLIVPTAGVKAWLAPQIASRLGATDSVNDGVLMNVRIGYAGMLNSILRGGINDEHDPWSIENMTMALLHILTNDSSNFSNHVAKHGGKLRAARALADRFDRYAARRPSLIRNWERAHSANELLGADSAQVEWQYSLWRQLRSQIGVPSWPARTEQLCKQLDSDEKPSHLPKKLMVAGMGTLSVSAIEIISALSKVIEVEVLCVNPSPYLSKEWSKQHSQIQVASGNAPARNDDLHVLPESDVLVTTWLRESYELQMLLTSQGVEYVTSEVSQSTSKSTKLLHRMHAAVQTPNSLQSQPLDAGDLSVQIHRAHTLGRQAEILRDALLHSFSTIDNLQPHEVIVLCADIEAAAPLLRATFEEPLTLGSGERVKIPFVVADRTLRESSIGAELAADILSLIGSRFDVDSVVNIATHELVLKNAYMGSGDVDAWLRHIHNTRVRWGLDVEHRKLNGLDAPEITAHTWKQLVDRTLLGALLPDAEETMFEMGGIVPVPRIDTTEIEALTGFAEVLSVLASLEHDSQSDMSIDFWCDRIEATLISLCGRSCTDLDDVLAVINKFREAALLASAGNQSVAFSEFAFLVTSEISAQSGRQSLVTGAVTATSFIPLRAVPFRVVCVVGLDDGTMSIGDSEGDDLIAMEQLMGDTDMRTANRRVLLDAVVAASEQLIITCNGSSVKNNTRVPFITPLAELVDFCGRLGVNVPNESDKQCEIEYLHSRHSSGTANFVANNGPVSGQIWSHDASALNAALSRSQVVAPQLKTYVPSQKPAEIEIESLEQLVIDPLKYYLRESLQIFTEYEEEDAKAVLPLDANEFEIAKLVEALVDASPNGDLEAGRSIWMPSAEASDALPVAPFAKNQIDRAFAIGNAVRGEASLRGIPMSDPDPIEFSLLLLDGSTIVCDVANVVESATEGLVYSISYHSKITKELIRQSVRLLALCAAGKLVQKAFVIQMKEKKDSFVLVNEIELSPEISADEALRRLFELSKAAHIARDLPCAKFDKTGQAIAEVGTINDDSVIDAFESFVDGFSYERSAEFVVYGADPVFEHVYSDNSDKKIEVLTALFQGCNLEKDGRENGIYQHWVVK